MLAQSTLREQWLGDEPNLISTCPLHLRPKRSQVTKKRGAASVKSLNKCALFDIVFVRWCAAIGCRNRLLVTFIRQVFVESKCLEMERRLLIRFPELRHTRPIVIALDKTFPGGWREITTRLLARILTFKSVKRVKTNFSGAFRSGE